MNKITLWKQEHPRADVPDIIADSNELMDVSWRNDACPSFNLKGYESGQKDIRLWVEYADETLREVSGENRYIVTFHDWDVTDSQCTAYEGNDAQAAIEALKQTVQEKG